MRRLFLAAALSAAWWVNGQNLKYIIYDFDGLNIGQTDLPDGDYRNNDLTYFVDQNPLAPSDVIGDRVLRLEMNWNVGVGEFGKATKRFLELDPSADRFNFYIYNPLSNSADAQVQVVITEDDNGSLVYESNADDKWTYTANVMRSGAWQLVSIPLSSFVDGNSGGNGVFDASYTGAGGMLHSVSLTFSRPAGASYDKYYVDMLAFTEGDMPHGASILDLPPKNAPSTCLLGALTGSSPDQTPAEVHGYLPGGKRISYVNWFVYYSSSGTVANKYTGPEVQSLLDQDIMPIITWESMYNGYSRLDPVQPRLDNITNGSLDGYIDAFANQIKTYTKPVIIRILHEFEGDWYPWSLTQNGQDPAKYIAAFRHIVDRFRNLGVNNVKWMWCLNAEPKPYRQYNYVVSCYPGDNYVDIVATDIYNHPDLGTPDWKSFRYTMTESYYYLKKHYSHKPIFVCEVGCRERDSGEPGGSQSKADWTCQMSRDLSTYFGDVQALVFFSMVKEHDWRINSSQASLDAFINCIWNDSYYYGPTSAASFNQPLSFTAYPNPFQGAFSLRCEGGGLSAMEVSIFDMQGWLTYSWTGSSLPATFETPDLEDGMYIVVLRTADGEARRRIIKRSR